MKLKYAIVAPQFRMTSAGVRVLYKLNDHLNSLEQKSRIITLESGLKPTEDEIVIYPDCYAGNIFEATKVVRFLLMHAGFFGQDRDFPENEMMYYYLPDYVLNNRNPENILTVPVLEEERFPARFSKDRSGTAYLALKYQDHFGLPVDVPEDAIRITRDTDIQELLGRVKKLITYDNSLINLEATLAGVEVEYRFNEKFPHQVSPFPGFDWSTPAVSYREWRLRYYTLQLPKFIQRTHDRFGNYF